MFLLHSHDKQTPVGLKLELMMLIFNAMLLERFSAGFWLLTCRNFSKFSESFGKIMDCR